MLSRLTALFMWSTFSRATALQMTSPLPLSLSKKSTAQDVVDMYAQKGLRGKCAVVTGGNSGIGFEAARVLALAGARVVLCSRSEDAGEEAKSKIEGDVIVQKLDLASLESVEAAAAGIKKKIAPLNLDFLILNAGIMALPDLQHTTEGFEMQVGTNHFGHAHLTNQLLDVVESHASRVVVLSSTAHNFGDVVPDNLHFKGDRSYTPWGAYGQSKACNLLYAKSLSEKLSGGASAFSVHPGVIRTNLWREPQGGISFFGVDKLFGRILPRLVADKTIEQGAATTLYACLAPRLDKTFNGAYLADCDVAVPNAKLSNPVLRDSLWKATMDQLSAASITRSKQDAGNICK